MTQSHLPVEHLRTYANQPGVCVREVVADLIPVTQTQDRPYRSTCLLTNCNVITANLFTRHRITGRALSSRERVCVSWTMISVGEMGSY